MLFLGLGTGLGSALMVRGHIVPMELGALSYKNGAIEDYLGTRGLQKLGKKKWRKAVEFWVKRFTSALLPDDVVIGGGNAKKLRNVPPPGCRMGDNANAFLGGFQLWEESTGMATRNLGAALAPLFSIAEMDQRAIVMVVLGLPMMVISALLAARWIGRSASTDGPGIAPSESFGQH